MKIIAPTPRHLRIGASDVAAILGISPFKTPYDVWCEKKQIEKYIAQETTDAMKWGNILEPVVGNYCKDYFSTLPQLNIKQNDIILYANQERPLSQHPLFDFIGVELDGWIPSQNIPLEIKTANAFSASEWGESGTCDFPMYYVVQLATQCNVMGADKGILAVLIGGNTFKWYLYESNRELEEEILYKITRFWNENVLEDIPPAPTNIEDCKNIYRKVSLKSSLVADDNTKFIANEIKYIKESIKALEKKESELKYMIMANLREKENLIDENGVLLCSWRQNAKGNRTFLIK